MNINNVNNIRLNYQDISHGNNQASKQDKDNKYDDKDEICICKKLKPNLNNTVSVLAPSVPVKTVVKLGYNDHWKLRDASIVPPLDEHFQESGAYNGKMYTVIDGVIYETDLPKSMKEDEPKTFLDLINESHKKIKEKNKTEEEYSEGKLIDFGSGKGVIYGKMDDNVMNIVMKTLSYIK